MPMGWKGEACDQCGQLLLPAVPMVTFRHQERDTRRVTTNVFCTEACRATWALDRALADEHVRAIARERGLGLAAATEAHLAAVARAEEAAGHIRRRRRSS